MEKIYGKIIILPTKEQFELAKDKEIDLQDLELEDKVIIRKSKEGKEFKTCKIKLFVHNKLSKKFDYSATINVAGDYDVEKVLLYAEEKIPVGIMYEEKQISEDFKLNNLVALEDRRPISEIQNALSLYSEPEYNYEETSDVSISDLSDGEVEDLLGKNLTEIFR